MSYDCHILTSIREANREEWNQIVSRTGGTVFHTYEWLKSYEDAPPSNLFNVRHLEIRRAGNLIAVAPLYEISHDPHFTSYRSDYGFDHPLLQTRMLVCHSWYSYYNQICTTEPYEAVVPVILDNMRVISEELDIPMYGFPGVAPQDPLNAILCMRRFHMAHTEGTNFLILPPSADMTTYLMTLKRKIRSELVRLSRKAVKHGARLSLEKHPDYITAFTQLLQNICVKHQSPMSNPPANLRSIFANLDPYMHFLTMWWDETMLGGMILLEFNCVLYAWIAGLNYDYLREFGTYFALYFFMMDHAFKLGINRVEVGRGLYDIKIKLGFQPLLLHAWFQATNSLAEQTLVEGLAVLERTVRTPERIQAAYAATNSVAPGDQTWQPVPRMDMNGYVV